MRGEKGGMRLYPGAAFETVMEKINKHDGIIYNVRYAPRAKVDDTDSLTGSETYTQHLIICLDLFGQKIPCFTHFISFSLHGQLTFTVFSEIVTVPLQFPHLYPPS